MNPELLRALPTVNACLNSLSAILLVIGFVLVKRGKIDAHRKAMLGACASSTLFLVSYLVYHYFAGSVKFTGTGALRVLYFTILLTHTVLAVAVVPLAAITLINGLKLRVPQHRRIARWAFPVWMYVSVTGVLVYMFLYQWFPSRPF